MENYIKVENLHKSFVTGGSVVEAIRGLSFSINRGEFVAIMGISGSGKSTLLHLLSGLTSPDSGQIIIDGIELNKLSDQALTRFRRDNLGIVFQAFNLVSTLTVRENLALPALAAGKKIDVDSLSEKVNIKNRLNFMPDVLSGGEQQRVAIGRALVNDNALIMADEPTGNLDSENSQRICQLLEQLNKEDKRTILMVTHEPSVAWYADRFILVYDGKIVADFAKSSFESCEEFVLKYQSNMAKVSK
ncbi:MAG: ABC transporter ATP-binding protein [Lentisphaeria bacterium]